WLFKKEAENKEVDFFELGKWILENYDLYRQLDAYFAELKELLLNIHPKIDVLEKVDVKEKKYDEKLKSMVEGNKPAYIMAVRLLLKRIIVPDNYDSKSVCTFVAKVDDELKDFNRRTARNYFILQSIIGDELAAVVQDIKKVDVLAKMINDQACNGKLKDMEDFQMKLSDIYSYIGRKEEDHRSLVAFVKEREKLLEMESKLKDEIEKNRKGKDFAEMSKLEAEKEELAGKLYEMRSVFEGDFSVLQRPLKKLEKIDAFKTLKHYVDKPFDTFVEDHGLELNLILGSLKAAIDAGKIDTKNKDKVYGVIGALPKERLNGLNEKYSHISRQISEIGHRLSKNEFMKKEHMLVGRSEELIQDIGKIDELISKFKKRNINADIEGIRKDLGRLGIKAVLKNVPLDA
ncbi:MAG: hypothetical protein V1906_00345, partial [Candidatus Woesearchaeota archaeon]